MVSNANPEDVTVLIGIDIAAAHNHKNFIEPPEGIKGPIAFGWPNGTTGRRRTKEVSSFVSHVSTIIRSEESDDSLNKHVKKFWQLEAKEVNVKQPVISENDLPGQRILESTVKNIGERYQFNLFLFHLLFRQCADVPVRGKIFHFFTG